MRLAVLRRINPMLLTAFVVLVALAGPSTGAAAADSPAVTIIPPASLHHPPKPYYGPVAYSAYPGVFRIEASVPAGDWVSCVNTVNGSSSCGTRTTSDCPAGDTCWDYTFPRTPTADYPYSLTAAVFDAAGNNEANTSSAFYVDAYPTQTRILDVSGAPLRPGFQVVSAPDYGGQQGKVQYQCRFIPYGTHPAWAYCGGAREGYVQDGSYQVHTKLRPRHIYRFQARITDIFGRTDPTPAQLTYSPTPCRIHSVGHPSIHTLITHGLIVRVSCYFAVDATAIAAVSHTVARHYHLAATTVGGTSRDTKMTPGKVTTLRLRVFPADRGIRHAGSLRLHVYVGDAGLYYYPDEHTRTLHG